MDKTEEITEMFYSVFEFCGNEVLKESDEVLAGIIYEDYLDYYSYWLDCNLIFLKENGILSEDVVKQVQEIRSLSDAMFAPGMEFSAQFIRKSKTWKKIFDMADQLKAELNIKK